MPAVRWTKWISGASAGWLIAWTNIAKEHTYCSNLTPPLRRLRNSSAGSGAAICRPADARRTGPSGVTGESDMAESRGRPGSAGQRPTGGDKAVATQKKQYFRRKKVCRFCVEKIDDINYKDVRMLSSFVAERGKIVPRRISGVCAPHQRRLADAIKKARNIALLPFAAVI